MKAKLELTEDDIRSAISNYISSVLGLNINPTDILIEVKSKQNYKSEWEQAAIRCNFEAKPESGL
jgi:hypothetical protein